MKDPKTLATSAGINTRDTRFIKPAADDTFAVCFESVENIGPDNLPALLTRHSATIEFYAKKGDASSRSAQSALENAMSAAGVEWTKSDRIWLEEEKIFQTVYNYQYLLKG